PRRDIQGVAVSTTDTQALLKEEAKTLRTRIGALIRDAEEKTRMVRTLCIYAGLLTETLLEYEEPDAVMEQALYRIADLIASEPSEDEDTAGLMPFAWDIDRD